MGFKAIPQNIFEKLLKFYIFYRFDVLPLTWRKPH